MYVCVMPCNENSKQDQKLETKNTQEFNFINLLGVMRATRQIFAARNKKAGILKDKTFDMQCKKLEEEHRKHTSVDVPQYFQNNNDSDSEESEDEEGTEEDLEEEPEADPKEEPEVDIEEGPEEDPEEDPETDTEDAPEEDPEEESEECLETELKESTKEQTQGKLIEGSKVELDDGEEEDLSEEQDKRLTVECVAPFKSCGEKFSAEQPPEHEDDNLFVECVVEPTKIVYQDSSDDKQKIMVDTAEPSLSKNYGLKKNSNNKDVQDAFNSKYSGTDQHSVPGGLEAVIGDGNSTKQADSGKRRRSRWDYDPRDDQKTVTEDKQCKKRKTRWDADDSKSRSLLDWEVLALRKRFLELSSIRDPFVDNKLEIEVHPPEMMSYNKLIQERENIFIKLAQKNAIFCKELYVPVKEYPTYNFIGLILGPKGKTQKWMEVETGAKIRLRGKGSSRTAQESDASKDKDLHVRIEAVSQTSLDAAVGMVEKLLIPVEEGMNDLKRAQLQDLGSLKAAAINNSCSVCKETGHSHFVCPQKNSTLQAACDTCGSFSHPTSGCLVIPSHLKTKHSKELSAVNLYVGFLPQTVNNSRLRELFSPFGTITESVVTIDKITGYSKGYGFVKFDNPSSASLAIMQMNGYQMDGHRLAVKLAGTPPATGTPTTSLRPVYPIPGPAAVATSCPTFPHYMLPEAQVSVLKGESLAFPSSLNMEYDNRFSQTGAPFIPQRVSELTRSRTEFSSAGFVSTLTESGTAFMSTRLVQGPTESITASSSAGLKLGSTESRSVSSSTNVVSMFPGNPDYPGLFLGSSESRTAFSSAGFLPGSADESRNVFPSTSTDSMFPGDPDYPGSGFKSYFS
ncbi:uncharacterized protein LOC141720702 isoform X2 [Apium graveolens]|uniref:uncharacterized protein LOC141720702 isoform X2 n=1 Tax=Apium graveolens TaxID=4045 RepID=UPI003D7B165E